jgi:signal transduction histidine kinase
MIAPRRPGSRLNLILAAGVAAATAALVGLGALAIREWRRSSLEVLERQADVTLALLANAIHRDMKGAHVSLLLPLQAADVVADPPHDLRRTLAARGFARFPYPDWFFVAREHTWLLTRAERPPAWQPPAPSEPHPVRMIRDPPALASLVDEVRRQAERFVVLEWAIAGARYQIVAVTLRDGRRGPVGVAGFAVDLRWVREHYFAELAQEIAGLGGHQETVSLAIVDEAGALVTSTGQAIPSHSSATRTFPLLFFDPAMRPLLPTDARAPVEWTARAAVERSSLEVATRGARRTLVLLGLAAVAGLAGLLFAVRAVSARAELASLKSDFVATVTHELKAPLAVIRLVGDTLARGRYSSPETVGEYARLASREASRLARLIDNLLTYARISDKECEYRFEALDVAELVDDVVTRFRPRLDEQGFETTVEVPLDLPRVRADRGAMVMVLDNVIDNAIKYAGERRSLHVRALPDGAWVRLEVTDRGRGIPEADLPRVFDRFYRGRDAPAGGSGLGLAIVRRALRDHGGRVEVTSRVGEGTTVVVWLPA